MDRELNSILKRLLSHSTEMEASLVRSNSNLVEALVELDSLETITRASLMPPEQISAPTPAPTPVVAHAVTQPVAAPVYESTKNAYRPALENDTLVEALLEYHRRTAARKKAAAAAKPGFTAASIPEVQAEVKQDGPYRRGPGIAYPVLRSKRD